MVAGAGMGVGGLEGMAKSTGILLGVMEYSRSHCIDGCKTLNMLKPTQLCTSKG